MSDEWAVTHLPTPASDPVSPHVLQFLIDYKYTHGELLKLEVDPIIDIGMGSADLVLSIVNDSYAHNRMDAARKPTIQPTTAELEELVEELGGIGNDDS